MEKFPSARSEKSTPKTPEVIRPEFFDSVQFELVRDGEGGLVGYKSSEFGRKRIALSPDAPESLLFNLDLDREYKVRVIGDTEPDDPERGTYIVEIESENSEDDGLEHQEAQRARAQHFKESPGFQVVAQMLNSDPDLSEEYRSVVGRNDEYKDSMHQDAAERHRGFTGMLAGLMMSERGKRLLDRTIDLTVRERSATIKERLREAPRGAPEYVPGVVIGAGVHGAIFATERQVHLPAVPDLTIEAEDRIGGQFAQYRSNLFRVNSRRRPELPDAPHLPGTQQSLNSAGTHAVMQSSDTGHESYPHQSTISDTTRANLFLSGESMVSTEIKKVRQNTNTQAPGALILECMDRETGRVIEVATDRVVFSTGIGEEVDRLDPEDATTQRILTEEREKMRTGGDARVRSFTEFTRAAANPGEAHPLKGMKRIVLSGSGDSANVIAGILLGYESQLGKSSSQLDSVEEIYWIGQELASKEEFLECTRVRYAQIGLEFPRDRFEQYYHRIKPIQGVRSNRLRRTDSGGIEVFLSDSSGASSGGEFGGGFDDGDLGRRSRRGRARLRNQSKDRAAKGSIEGDYFIYAHGFQDRTDEVIAPAYKQITPNESDSLEGKLNGIRRFPDSEEGTDIYFKKGPFRRVSITSCKQPLERASRDNYLERILITLQTYTADGTYTEEVISGGEFSERQAYFDITNIDHIEEALPLTPAERSDIEFALVRGKGRPIARSYDSPRDSDVKRETLGQIYKVGPAAQLELSDEEREQSPALAQISENTASIFRYVDLTEALAQRIAKYEKIRGVEPARVLESLAPEEYELPLPPRTTKKPTLRIPIDTAMRALHAKEAIGLGENSADLLKLGIGNALAGARFPSQLQELSFTVEGTGGRDAEEALTVESGLLVSDEYRTLINSLLQDSLVSATMRKIVSNTRAGKIKVTIPIRDQQILGSGVQYAVA